MRCPIRGMLAEGFTRSSSVSRRRAAIPFAKPILPGLVALRDDSTLKYPQRVRMNMP